jgi:hypothetical protein
MGVDSVAHLKEFMGSLDIGSIDPTPELAHH